MSAISLKSITGITSITTPAGVDNVFTVHTNDTTERFRVDSNGNQRIAGILTVTQDLDVDGHTNLDNVSITGVSTFSDNIFIPDDKKIKIGDHSDIQIYNDGTKSVIENGGYSLGGNNNSLHIYSLNDILHNTTYSQYFHCGATNNSSTSPRQLALIRNEGVKAYYNNNLKLETSPNGVDITGGLTVSGITTFTGAIDANGDLDVDGQTSLDHVTIAGITTFQSGAGFDLATNNVSAGMRIINNGNSSSDGMYIGYGNANNGVTRLFGGGSTSNPTVINSTGVSIPNDLDVDGHTNLDNVSVAGVTTFTGNISVTGGQLTLENGNEEQIHRYWTNGTDSDIYGLLSGSTFGTIVEGAHNGHHVIALRDNDVDDSFAIVSGGSNYQTDTTYDKLVARFRSNGNTNIGGTLDVAGETVLSSTVRIADTITHIGDSNTKIRFPAADTISFETAGSERARFTKDGNLFVGSNVSQFYPYDSFTNDALFMVNGNLPTINGAGQATILTKAAYNASDRRALLSFGGNYFSTGQGSQTFLAGIGGEKENTTSGNFAGALMFYTRPHGGNETERLRIDSSGKIGISRTPTQHPLEIQHSSEPTVSLWRGSTKGAALQAQSGATYFYSYENAPLVFSVNSAQGFSERLRIDSNGMIGIGGVTPKTQNTFDVIEFGKTGFLGSQTGARTVEIVSNAYYNSGWKYKENDVASQYYQYQGYHAFGSATSGSADAAVSFTERLRIESDGNLTLTGTTGNSSPRFTIKHSNADVEGEVIRFARTELPTIRYHSIKAKHSGGAVNNYISVNVHDGGSSPYTSQTEVARFLGAGGMTFNGDTAAANALDDYEEGSHTFADSSTAGLSISNVNTGKYTKIGRMVIITFDLRYPSTSDTNIARVTSPFAASTGYGNGWVGWTELGRPMQVHISGTTVYFMDNNVGGTGKHLYNNELSGKRFIGGFIVS